MCFVLIRCETVPSRFSRHELVTHCKSKGVASSSDLRNGTLQILPSDHLLCSIVVTELVEVTRRVPTP